MFIFFQANPHQKYLLGRFIDGYLMLVAGDENLSAMRFQSLAEAMAKDDQQCDKTYILYRTIDMYLNVWNVEVGLKDKIYVLA